MTLVLRRAPSPPPHPPGVALPPAPDPTPQAMPVDYVRWGAHASAPPAALTIPLVYGPPAPFSGAVARRELHLDLVAWATPLGVIGRPAHTGVALRTGHLLGRPINGKAADIQAIGLPGLPAVIPQGWADHINLMGLLTVHQGFGGHRARIEQVFTRQQLVLGQMLVNRRRNTHLGGGRRCFDVDHKMRLVVVTGFGEMALVARPGAATFGAKAGIHRVG